MTASASPGPRGRIATNLLTSTVVSVALVPLLWWSLPPDRQEGAWMMVLVMVLLAYAAPFLRDFARRRR